MAVLTFSRTYGCGVRELGRELARELGYMYFEKELIPLIFKQIRLSKKEQRASQRWTDSVSDTMIDFICTAFPFIRRGFFGEDLFVSSLKQVIMGLAEKGNVIILGRGSQVILQDFPGAVHVRFIADLDYRIAHLKKTHQLENLTAEEIENTIKQHDAGRREFVKYNFKRDIDEPSLYHLIIDLSKIHPEEAKKQIKELIAHP